MKFTTREHGQTVEIIAHDDEGREYTVCELHASRVWSIIGVRAAALHLKDLFGSPEFESILNERAAELVK